MRHPPTPPVFCHPVRQAASLVPAPLVTLHPPHHPCLSSALLHSISLLICFTLLHFLPCAAGSITVPPLASVPRRHLPPTHCLACHPTNQPLPLFLLPCAAGSITVPSLASVLNEFGLKKNMETSVLLQVQYRDTRSGPAWMVGWAGRCAVRGGAGGMVGATWARSGKSTVHVCFVPSHVPFPALPASMLQNSFPLLLRRVRPCPSLRFCPS